MVFLTLLRTDIKLILKDWKAVALLLVLPFLFICFFAYALSPYLDKSSFIEPFSIALVDQEDTAQTRILSRQLMEIGIFKEVLRVDEDEAEELISENRVASVIIIPEGFSESIVTGENKPVTVIGNRSLPLQSFVVKNIAEGAANLVSAGQSAINTIYHYSQKAGLEGKELEKEFNDSVMKFFLKALARNEIYSSVEASPVYDLTPVEYFTSALIVVFLLFARMPAMKMLVTERIYGLARRLKSSPVRVWQVILSKFTVSLFLSLLQFLMIIVLTALFFKNYWGAPVKNIFMLFGGILFAVSSWSIFVSSISKTPASADIIGNLGILLMAVVGGSIYPLSSMPGFVRSISRLTINRWAMEGFMVIFSGDHALSPVHHVYMLLLIGLVLLAASAGALKLRRS